MLELISAIGLIGVIIIILVAIAPLLCFVMLCKIYKLLTYIDKDNRRFHGEWVE